MSKMSFASAALAGLIALSASSGVEAAQVLSFSGTLQNGYNQGGPFGGTSFTDLTGKAYSISISYDPSQFLSSSTTINSCGTGMSVSCSFYLSSTRTLTENITVNGITRMFTYTSGNFALNSAGNDQFDFNVQDSSGNNFSGSFSDSNGFYPNQNNVDNPVFAAFTNMALRAGNFTQYGTGYSIGANPSQLTASTSGGAVPEPATWGLMLIGFGAIGAMARARRPERARHT